MDKTFPLWRGGFVVIRGRFMKTIVKTLIVTALFLSPLLFARCAATRGGSRCCRPDSLVTISKDEYEMLKQRADERYVVVQRRAFDSLLMKTKALQELCDQLIKHLPEEIRSENNRPGETYQQKR